MVSALLKTRLALQVVDAIGVIATGTLIGTKMLIKSAYMHKGDEIEANLELFRIISECVDKFR